MAINIKKKIGIVVSAGQMSGGVFQYTESILDAMNRSNVYDIILFYYDEIGLFNKYKFSKRKLTTLPLVFFKSLSNYFNYYFRLGSLFF